MRAQSDHQSKDFPRAWASPIWLPRERGLSLFDADQVAVCFKPRNRAHINWVSRSVVNHDDFITLSYRYGVDIWGTTKLACEGVHENKINRTTTIDTSGLGRIQAAIVLKVRMNARCRFR